jgi:hypothetical protein
MSKALEAVALSSSELQSTSTISICVFTFLPWLHPHLHVFFSVPGLLVCLFCTLAAGVLVSKCILFNRTVPLGNAFCLPGLFGDYCFPLVVMTNNPKSVIFHLLFIRGLGDTRECDLVKESLINQ